MFSLEFMQNAYLAGTLIAIVSGIMGVRGCTKYALYDAHTF